jgi:aryl-alcohol dehydrogenase-like predicted oxidoreductase
MKLILGTAQFDNSYGIGRQHKIDAFEAHAILEYAFEIGIRHLDTSPDYGLAHKLISENSKKFNIHTKIRDLNNVENDLESIASQINRDLIDIIYIHDPKISSLPLEDFDLLLTFQGKMYDKLGISVYCLDEFYNSIKLGIFQVIQVPMNLLDKRFKEVLDIASELGGTKIIARSILLQGLLARSSTQVPKKLLHIRNQIFEVENLAQRHKFSMTELAIRWAVSQDNLDGITIGVESVSQLKNIVDIFRKGKLTENILREIEQINVLDISHLDPRFWNDN